eukprot:scaffold31275_cov120-Isochrysis_galbana.AAC.2
MAAFESICVVLKRYSRYSLAATLWDTPCPTTYLSLSHLSDSVICSLPVPAHLRRHVTHLFALLHLSYKIHVCENGARRAYLYLKKHYLHVHIKHIIYLTAQRSQAAHDKNVKCDAGRPAFDRFISTSKPKSALRNTHRPLLLPRHSTLATQSTESVLTASALLSPSLVSRRTQPRAASGDQAPASNGGGARLCPPHSHILSQTLTRAESRLRAGTGYNGIIQRPALGAVPDSALAGLGAGGEEQISPSSPRPSPRPIISRAHAEHIQIDERPPAGRPAAKCKNGPAPVR